MNWQTFRTHLKRPHYCSAFSAPKTIAGVLGDLAGVTTVPFGANAWYPLNVPDGGLHRGYRYVDMDHCYYGGVKTLVAEASNCVILILVDPQGQARFACHLSALTGGGALVPITAELRSFFEQGVQRDVGRPNVFIFTEDARMLTGEQSTYELNNTMDLLSSVFSDASLEWLALSTYVISGQGGQSWNSYCSVRIDQLGHSPRLQIVFAG